MMCLKEYKSQRIGYLKNEDIEGLCYLSKSIKKGLC